MDTFSRFVEAFPIPNQKSETIARVILCEFLCRYAYRNTFHTDRGTNYCSSLIQDLCKLIDARKTKFIRAYLRGQDKDWDLYLN